jgi:hypothetical protein
MRHICAVLLCVAVSSVVWAQEPKDVMFIGYDLQHITVGAFGASAGTTLNGFTFSNSVRVHKWFGVEGDLSMGYKSIDGVNLFNIYGLGGPKVSYTFGSVSPFGHFLIGLDRVEATNFAGESALALGGGGGVDIYVTKHFGLRGGFDYLHASKYGVGLGTYRITAGPVFRFGGTGMTIGRPASAPPPSAGSVSTKPIQTAPQEVPPPHRAAPSYHRGAAMQVADLGVAVVSGASDGAEIVEVVRGSVADWAGLKPGDVINGIDGKAVKNPMELAAALSGRATGDKVRLAFMVRGYWQTETTLVLGGQK